MHGRSLGSGTSNEGPEQAPAGTLVSSDNVDAVGRIGGAFQACLRAYRVVAVDAEAVRVVTRTASRPSIFRAEESGVLASDVGATERDRR
jgi:hypothetical protein